MSMRYQVICVQPAIYPARNRQDVAANVRRNAEMIDEMVFLQHRRQETRGAGKVRLLAYPEYGFSDWREVAAGTIDGTDVAIEIPGPEIQPLADAARRNKVFIAAQAMEALPQFPGHFLNAAFIFGPDGELVYKRHKLRHGLLTLYTSPHDVLDKYMAEFSGGRSVGQTIFPVVETEIGRLGMLVCHEVRTPEVARQLTANGAEVIIRPTIEPEVAGRVHLDRARAIENKVYWLVSNAGQSIRYPTNGDSGASRVIGFKGEIIAESHQPDTTVWGEIDVRWLRESRGPAALPPYAASAFDYHLQESVPANMFADGRPTRQQLEEKYVELGLLPPVAGN